MSNHEDLVQAYKTVEAVTLEVARSVEMPRRDLLVVVGAFTVGESVFIEGIPGNGKTTLAKSMATAVNGSFGRVQGTSEVLPSDITGNDIFDQSTQRYVFQPGPVFSNVLLVDEMGRLSPKTQSALFEAQQEKQVTVNGRTHQLPRPSVAIATNNPHAYSQGVNIITEAGIDRYGVTVEMPEHDEDMMLQVHEKTKQGHYPQTAVELRDMLQAREAVSKMDISSEVLRLAARAVVATREHAALDPETTVLGGQRPFANLLKVASVVALMDDSGKMRQTVNANDVAVAAHYVLPHRMGLTYKAAEQTNKQEVIDEALRAVATTRS